MDAGTPGLRFGCGRGRPSHVGCSRRQNPCDAECCLQSLMLQSAMQGSCFLRPEFVQKGLDVEALEGVGDFREVWVRGIVGGPLTIVHGGEMIITSYIWLRTCVSIDLWSAAPSRS